MAAQNAACQPVGLADQPEQQVLAADVVVAERRGFGDGELESRDRGVAETRSWPIRSRRRVVAGPEKLVASPGAGR